MPKNLSLPSVSLYICITDDQCRRYERINRRNPQICGPRDVYCLHYYLNGKRKWLSVGTDLNAASKARGQKEQELLLLSKDTPAQTEPSPDASKCLEQLRETFLDDKRISRKKNGELRDEDTIHAYEKLTREFLDFVKVTQPEQITVRLLKAWITSLYERKRHHSEECISHRTVCNHYINTVSFLHFIGVDHKKLVPEAERPAVVDEEPEAYSEVEMTLFFAEISDERDRLFFTFLRRVGAREREATHLEWTNLNLSERPTVTFRNQGGFKTKTRKFRTVPLDPDFAAELRAWRITHGHDRYVFGRKDGKAEGHYLDLSPFLAQPVKTQSSANGENESWECHGGRLLASSSWPPYGGWKRGFRSRK